MGILDTRVSKRLARLAFAGLLAQALVPGGFMLSSPAEGWPVTPCPGQSRGLLSTGPAMPMESHSGHPAESGDDCSNACLRSCLAVIGAEVEPFVTPDPALTAIGRSNLDEESESDVSSVRCTQPRGPPAV